MTDTVRLPRSPWSNEDQLRLLGLITPGLTGLPVGELHDLSLTIGVDPASKVDGDCRLDGAASLPILEAVKTFSWPKLSTPYVFKKYYLTRTASAAAAREFFRK